jgi:hypothetical protein
MFGFEETRHLNNVIPQLYESLDVSIVGMGAHGQQYPLTTASVIRGQGNSALQDRRSILENPYFCLENNIKQQFS